ncbi:3-oxoacyl-ACP synthase III family protein [Clostridium sp. DJ247]|uniref:3-oxoacyl-ACP synthase III family protein n=1 Tax=Clostridium sp. DJ247 TaxID=2726188 RepID=UPI0016235324|nr:ketoacyl-ACP synthase III [Clostridium sp. DJ247]MBC2580392.1 ketoacyl-ACP synthase III [Clostridium sp. DJ247]
MTISAVVTGVGRYLPKRVVDSKEVEDMAGFQKFGIRNGMVKLFTGVDKRHYAAEDEHCSDMAIEASKEALKSSGLKPEDIDVVIFCAITQDFAEPATANIIHGKLGTINAHCFDVKNACNAFVNGIDLADSLIRSGKAKHVLIASGEVPSRMIKFNCETREELERKNATLSVGDGGVAFVLSAIENTNRGIVDTHLLSMGQYWDQNVVWGGGVRFPRDTDKFYLSGETNKIIKDNYETAPVFFKECIEKTGWEVDSVDFFILSQVTKYLQKEMCRSLNIPQEKTISIIEKIGNTCAGGVPMAMYEAATLSKIKPGDRVVIIATAAGYSMACICLVW